MKRVFSLGMFGLVSMLAITGCFAVTGISSSVFHHFHEEIDGSGISVTETYDFENFDIISSNHAFEVTITRSPQYSVVVEIDQNFLPYFEIDQFGSRLRFDLDSDVSFDIDDHAMRVNITMPEIREISGHVVSRIDITGFETQGHVNVDLSAASSLRGDLVAGSLDVHLSGASSMILEGSATDLDLHVSGASSADLFDFPVVNADVHASGASSARVDVSGRLDAEANGVSSIYYRGNPELGSINSSGFSSIIHQD